jgi:enoyl-CoA hydratase
VTRSLVAAAGAALLLPQRIPRAIALEMLLTGEPVDAERAAAVGLVNRVVDEGTALEAAVEVAGVVAANGPLAVTATKEIAVSAPGWSRAEMWARQDALAGPVFASEDAKEGAAAFAERRPPQWRGR